MFIGVVGIGKTGIVATMPGSGKFQQHLLSAMSEAPNLQLEGLSFRFMSFNRLSTLHRY